MYLAPWEQARLEKAVASALSAVAQEATAIARATDAAAISIGELEVPKKLEARTEKLRNHVEALGMRADDVAYLLRNEEPGSAMDAQNLLEGARLAADVLGEVFYELERLGYEVVRLR